MLLELGLTGLARWRGPLRSPLMSSSVPGRQRQEQRLISPCSHPAKMGPLLVPLGAGREPGMLERPETRSSSSSSSSASSETSRGSDDIQEALENIDEFRDLYPKAIDGAPLAFVDRQAIDDEARLKTVRQHHRVEGGGVYRSAFFARHLGKHEPLAHLARLHRGGDAHATRSSHVHHGEPSLDEQRTWLVDRGLPTS